MIELNIITPCFRTENLKIIKETIRFDLINKWYIIYDTSRTPFVKRYNDPQIIELEVNHRCCGAPQRNLGLDTITSGSVYMLDDDNVMHHNFWNLLEKFEPNKIYTFDQLRCRSEGKLTDFKGGRYKKCQIDSAQFVVPKELIDKQRWVIAGCGDGIFIEELYSRHPDKFIYVPEVGCWWNKLNPR